ncbi:uncharacterized protein BO80DRAFT_492362 [Aspergillus ibericus CBS 121593]|uniref:Uncharacterized protein n=1 Tax=Aspergillus ibericus CBS 121593 TaxID=1448316 RepID=A0A395H4K1_9EURO|nr:hypothetical protein BO80DRAFT_492362 [Aspergillus ibericus CBS 121593]RAL02676.1 hypothetical protein BO80DRAFT_492362 [Aspergillus ibericus CBS 121593]
MFRRARETEPDRFSTRLSKTLHPLPMIPWGALAMCYLGVPIVVGASMIIVQDTDYPTAITKLESAGFIRTVPNRVPPPEIMADHPNPQQVLEEINAGYKCLDRSCAVFDYPCGRPEEENMQVYLFPDSFAHGFLPSNGIEDAARYAIYDNIHYPLEPTLRRSFSAWDESLRAWVAMMTGYLEVNNDILDQCPDQQAVEWYSRNFGRIREAKFGPIDRRISKRLGSGREMPVDMRGNPI